jgi:hypothetical protein
MGLSSRGGSDPSKFKPKKEAARRAAESIFTTPLPQDGSACRDRAAPGSPGRLPTVSWRIPVLDRASCALDIQREIARECRARDAASQVARLAEGCRAFAQEGRSITALRARPPSRRSERLPRWTTRVSSPPHPLMAKGQLPGCADKRMRCSATLHLVLQVRASARTVTNCLPQCWQTRVMWRRSARAAFCCLARRVKRQAFEQTRSKRLCPARW